MVKITELKGFGIDLKEIEIFDRSYVSKWIMEPNKTDGFREDDSTTDLDSDEELPNFKQDCNKS